MSRLFRYLSIVLVVLGFALILSSSHPALSASPSPRDNPEFRNMLSGIVVINPATSNPSLFHPFTLPQSFGIHLNFLADVPIGPNVLCNQDATTQAQNEPSIAVNPTDPNHIIATSNDYRLRVEPPPEHDVRAGYYVSFDGGNTWPGDGIIDISTIPNTYAAGDPAIAIHDIHNVYYSYIAFNRSTDDGGVAVSKSTDGGLTWLDPVVVDWNSASEFQDKEYLTVDATGSAYDGNVYVTWTHFDFSAPIYFSRSTDGGASFSVPYRISDTSYSSNQGSIPVVGPDGVIYVAWFNYDTGGVRMAKSTNGGQSFGTPFPVASVDEIPSPLPGGDFRDNSFPTAAVDLNTGYVYVAWSDYRNLDADIYFTRSTNGGTSWSEPVRINDDPLSNDAHQFFPWMDVSPNGNIYVGWFDSRLDPTPINQPLLFDEYVTVSMDAGLTFSPNQRMSEVTSDSSIGGFATPFIGDYSGLAATDDFVYPAWVDTRRNQEDIDTQRVYDIHGQKTAPTWINQFEPFTYSIVLDSLDNVTGNQVNDPIPSETSYVPGSAWASSGEVGFSEGTVTWNGDLSTAAPITITFAVTPTAASCLPITNTALLTTGQGVNVSMSATSVITGPLPSPEFSWVSSELVFTFTNETSGTTPIDTIWDFGDGITSTEVSPVHAYALPGDYVVTLQAANLCGSVDVSHPVTAVCTAPQAGFSWLDEELTVTFTNQSAGRFPLNFLWDFGDGITSTLTSPIHQYSLADTFDVTLNATDLCGSGSFTDQVTTTCTAPSAYFTWQTDHQSVSFTNLSAGTQPLTYLWDFGDGTSSTDQSPTHLFAGLGRYPVHLMVTGPCGTSTYETLVPIGQFIFLPLTVRQ
jgi:PKD repeat protein